MDILFYIFVGLLTLFGLCFDLYQHRKTRKDQQEIKTKLTNSKKRQLKMMRILTIIGKVVSK